MEEQTVKKIIKSLSRGCEEMGMMLKMVHEAAKSDIDSTPDGNISMVGRKMIMAVGELVQRKIPYYEVVENVDYWGSQHGIETRKRIDSYLESKGAADVPKMR